MAASITISNTSAAAMVAGRTVYAAINHASLVSARRSRADGLDLRIRYIPTGDILPVWVHNENTSAAVIYWSLQANLSSGDSTGNYELLFGGLPNDLIVPTRDLSHFHAAFGALLPSNRWKAPFLFFDDFSKVRSGGSWIGASHGASVPADVYESVGFTYDSGVGAAKAQISSGNYFAVHTDYHDFQHAVRVRAELLVETGSSAPQHGLRAWGDEASSFDGYFAGTASTGYTSGEIQINGTPQATGTLANRGGLWTPAIFSAISSAGISELSFRSEGSATLSYSDAGGEWNQGACGAYTGNSPETKYLWVRNFWVERWDAATTQWTATITLPSPAFPTYPWTVSHAENFGLVGTQRGRSMPGRFRARLDLPRSVSSIAWSELTLAETREIAAYVEATRGTPVVLSLPGKPVSKTYQIVPGSFSVRRENAGAFSAQLDLQLLW